LAALIEVLDHTPQKTSFDLALAFDKKYITYKSVVEMTKNIATLQRFDFSKSHLNHNAFTNCFFATELVLRGEYSRIQNY
jgi:hypothetical protein